MLQIVTRDYVGEHQQEIVSLAKQQLDKAVDSRRKQFRTKFGLNWDTVVPTPSMTFPVKTM